MAPRGQPQSPGHTAHGSADSIDHGAGPNTAGPPQHPATRGPAHPPSTSTQPAPTGVFVDAVTGRHASTSAADLLAKRRLTWDKHYGWTYDAWVDDPARYALAGANGREESRFLGWDWAGCVSS
ncbi:hypothetical protein HYH02_011400 [Chlamydomonas schloesseri]|uniref:Uncharacterized protein n=1 Tax=Chlamydomonas schloesseri TaxID=2026947 RepID=A0A835TE59_9CHLO|nr:hypothetical protein HYH02_011400 [Chlamydomonas schloesseri]|eukprot:KAG2437145.1 hypothetical protein HYH02_011400 [Chlamydomonas schloesseri]